mmetsp:Transcript_19826/g.51911  ORF Transcript_19826/g.51911 Transcript_19826/m.51911 type:complete len:513 (+) Transcript_19826:147-1685(+)|eukprot:CAMPEP_0119492286 /NCGR_PEP_ID=MMETSP1344-20130328/16874_1 /TAXON_ID=236787 /ORGANISM="Florenciella parvula, Strain CCMP2471" /LENGTH=512 /DNA_ID=CAMNT_0007527605 /DNA_START=169 /DNA_END=1707 /DNA_ORIENTATION=+
MRVGCIYSAGLVAALALDSAVGSSNSAPPSPPVSMPSAAAPATAVTPRLPLQAPVWMLAGAALGNWVGNLAARRGLGGGSKLDGLISEAQFNRAPVRFKYKPPVLPEDAEDIHSPKDPVLKKDEVKNHVFEAKPKSTCVIDYDYLETFIKDTFLKYGCTKADAALCADVLISSDKRGIDSHGIGRLKPIYCDRLDIGILNAQSHMSILKQTPTTAVVDGGLGLGLAIGPKCMQLAIDKAKKHGIGMVAVRNSTHYGFAGYYALMAEKEGCIGITGTNARPSIAPTYGVEPMMGTNPLVFGMPTDESFPFVLDCATSVNQRGKIEKYARESLPMPPGAVICASGEELTDANQILDELVARRAALTPLGGAGHEMAGYKGYGYAATVEILCAALQGNKWGEELSDAYIEDGVKKRRPSSLGHFFIAINVESFTSLDEFQRTCGQILRDLRGSEKDPNAGGRIYTAGEPEHLAWVHRSNTGGTPVPKKLQEDMAQLRDNFPAKLQEKYRSLPFEK